MDIAFGLGKLLNLFLRAALDPCHQSSQSIGQLSDLLFTGFELSRRADRTKLLVQLLNIIERRLYLSLKLSKIGLDT
jgi:hypothetical protein